MGRPAAGPLPAAALALCLAGAAAAGAAAPAGAAWAAADQQIGEQLEQMSQEDRELLRRVRELEARTRPPAAAGRAGALAAEEPQFHDRLRAFFHGLKDAANAILKPLLLTNGMFWLSAFLVLQWHIRFHFRELIHQFLKRVFGIDRLSSKPMMTSRRFGMNILIFVMYYDNDLPFSWLNKVVHRRHFVVALGLIFLDSVIIYYIFDHLGQRFGGTDVKENDEELQKDLPKRRAIRELWKDPLDENEDDGIHKEKTEGGSVYEDFTIGLERVVPLWFVQMGLVGLFIEELNGGKDTKNLDNVDISFWMLAVIFQIYAGEEQVGDAFSPVYWQVLLPWTDDQTTGTPDSVTRMEQSLQEVHSRVHKVFGIFDLKIFYEWRLRWMMDFMVNSVARSIILYTVPIVVSVEGPLDFVKDLTAVMFITTLDDVPHAKHIHQMVAKFKYRLFKNQGVPTTLTWARRKLGRAAGEPAGGDGSGECKLPLTEDEKEYVASHENADQFSRLKVLDQKKWEEFVRA